MNKPRFSLSRVRINQGGYDDSGRYWGVGEPLYFYESGDLGEFMEGDYIRAYDREDAKDKIRAKYEGAVFFR